MAKSKLSFPTKSFSIRISEDLSEVLESYVEEMQKEKGISIPRNIIVIEALMEYFGNKNRLPKK